MNIVKRLKQAADAGEILAVIYNGGSQPGTRREIAPIKVTDKEIRARCYASGAVKSFKVGKLEICGEESRENPYEANDKPTHYRDLIDALGTKKEELENLGWCVQLSEESISIYDYFKNGKARKTATAGILKSSDSYLRPWYVFGPEMATARTYGDLSKAVKIFLEQALNHAPAKKTI